MRKLIFIATIMPLIALANTNESLGDMDISKLPKPDSGVQVVPLSQLDSTPQEITGYLKNLRQFKSQGFTESNSEEPRRLMGLTSLKVSNSKDKYDTGLQSTISDMTLAFDFKGIPLPPNAQIVGYAVAGTWINGWTGVSEIFKSKDLGTCKYLLSNMKLTHSAVHIGKDFARYDVNSKPNILSVEGSINSGYMYVIGWYDDIYSKELQCANMVYDPEITKKLIDYAKLIDKAAM